MVVSTVVVQVVDTYLLATVAVHVAHAVDELLSSSYNPDAHALQTFAPDVTTPPSVVTSAMLPAAHVAHAVDELLSSSYSPDAHALQTFAPDVTTPPSVVASAMLPAAHVA